MRVRAFTLIELLVVVAIIAILTSILLPALSRARQQGKAVVCESNLHSLGLAVYLYAESNRGWFPQWGFAHGGGEAGAEHAWLRSMGKEYGEQRKVLRCPTDASRYWTQSFGGVTPPRLRKTSYASNYYLVEADTDLRYREGHPFNRLDWIRRPASTIFFVELVEEGDFALSDHIHPEEWDFYYPQDKQFAATQVALERHLKLANYALVDGHAERLPYEKTYAVDPNGGEPGRPAFFHNKYEPTVAR